MSSGLSELTTAISEATCTGTTHMWILTLASLPVVYSIAACTTMFGRLSGRSPTARDPRQLLPSRPGSQTTSGKHCAAQSFFTHGLFAPPLFRPTFWSQFARCHHQTSLRCTKSRAKTPYLPLMMVLNCLSVTPRPRWVQLLMQPLDAPYICSIIDKALRLSTTGSSPTMISNFAWTLLTN